MPLALDLEVHDVRGCCIGVAVQAGLARCERQLIKTRLQQRSVFGADAGKDVAQGGEPALIAIEQLMEFA